MWHFLRSLTLCGIFSVWHFLHVAFSPHTDSFPNSLIHFENGTFFTILGAVAIRSLRGMNHILQVAGGVPTEIILSTQLIPSCKRKICQTFAKLAIYKTFLSFIHNANTNAHPTNPFQIHLTDYKYLTDIELNVLHTWVC